MGQKIPSIEIPLTIRLNSPEDFSHWLRVLAPWKIHQIQNAILFTSSRDLGVVRAWLERCHPVVIGLGASLEAPPKKVRKKDLGIKRESLHKKGNPGE